MCVPSHSHPANGLQQNFPFLNTSAFYRICTSSFSDVPLLGGCPSIPPPLCQLSTMEGAGGAQEPLRSQSWEQSCCR